MESISAAFNRAGDGHATLVCRFLPLLFREGHRLLEGSLCQRLLFWGRFFNRRIEQRFDFLVFFLQEGQMEHHVTPWS